jgi:hypothetical protein
MTMARSHLVDVMVTRWYYCCICQWSVVSGPLPIAKECVAETLASGRGPHTGVIGRAFPYLVDQGSEPSR